MQLQSSILGRLDSELPGAICRDLGNPPCTPPAKRDRSNRPTSSREHEPQAPCRFRKLYPFDSQSPTNQNMIAK